jgi:hypothetical protein
MNVKLKTLIVMLDNPGWTGLSFNGFASGPANVSQYLKQKGYLITCHNMFFDDSIETLTAFISEEQFDVVMVGGYVTDVWRIKSVTDCAKKANKQITTIIGGGGCPIRRVNLWKS